MKEQEPNWYNRFSVPTTTPFEFRKKHRSFGWSVSLGGIILAVWVGPLLVGFGGPWWIIPTTLIPGAGMMLAGLYIVGTH